MLELYGEDISWLLRVAIVMGGMCWATEMAARAGADGFFSREVRVGTRVSSMDNRFGYFPVRIIFEVVVVVREGNCDEGELELLYKPVRGSRNMGEDFIVVCGSECKVSVNMMGSASSDHTATLLLLGQGDLC